MVVVWTIKSGSCKGSWEFEFLPCGQDYTKGSWTRYKHQSSYHSRQTEAIDDFVGLTQHILQRECLESELGPASHRHRDVGFIRTPRNFSFGWWGMQDLAQ